MLQLSYVKLIDASDGDNNEDDDDGNYTDRCVQFYILAVSKDHLESYSLQETLVSFAVTGRLSLVFYIVFG